MHNSFSHPLRRALLAALAVLALCAGPAQAKLVNASLRVEAAGKALAGGKTYATGTAKFKTDTRAACGGSGKTVTVPGATALGILATAAPTNPLLRPVGVSDKYSFGLVVCGIGRYVGFAQQSFWLYKVDHKSPEVGADQYKLKSGDQVLWFFEDTKTGSNTGDELALSAPAHAVAGKPFTVHVWDYDSHGKRKPAAGAKVGGKTTNASGAATIKVSKPRRLRLRATHGKDIPSAPTVVRVTRS